MPVIRTDSFTAGAGPLDSTWTQQRTAGTVNYNGSGMAVVSATDKDCFAFDNSNVYPNDQYSRTEIGANVSSNNHYFIAIARAAQSGDANFDNYAAATDGSTGAAHTDLAVNLNGAPTILRNFAATFVAGDSIEIQVVGTTIEVWKQASGGARSSLGTQVNATHASGSAGLGAYDVAGGTTPQIASWESGSFTVPAYPIAWLTA